MRRNLAAVVAVAGIAWAQALAAAEWGNLTMRFVYDGPPPPAKAIAAAAGPAAVGCGAGPFVEERLLVDAKDKGVANVCVWLLRTQGDKPPPVHESYDKSAKDRVTMTNKSCRFEPRILVVRTTQTFIGANADPTGHNMKADFFNPGNLGFNETIPAGGQMTKQIPRPEAAPTSVNCNIHGWMGGFLLIRDDPYAAISDAHGKLTLTNLPAGEWTFVVWHESGYVTKAKQGGKPQDWGRNGRVKIVIKPGDNDFGEYLLPPEEFP
jgi:hypothetical protein